MVTKHDKYVNDLYEKIKEYYDTIDTHVDITNSKRTVAEIDIMARKGDIIDVYEVKCSYRITKAKKQFKRIKRLLNTDKINFFFFCGASLSLKKVHI